VKAAKKAKKIAEAKAKTKRLRSGGFKRTIGGY
jgi:hypothetical protein